MSVLVDGRMKSSKQELGRDPMHHTQTPHATGLPLTMFSTTSNKQPSLFAQKFRVCEDKILAKSTPKMFVHDPSSFWLCREQKLCNHQKKANFLMIHKELVQ